MNQNNHEHGRNRSKTNYPIVTRKKFPDEKNNKEK